MSESLRLSLAVVLAALVAGAGVEAAVYKWADESGQTVYSQTPPPSGTALELKKPPEPDPAEAERSRETLRKELERSYDEAAERERVRNEGAEQQRDGKTRAKNCEAARSNLSTIENLGRRRVLVPDGEPVFLSEEERDAKMGEARANIKKYCD